MKDKSVEAMVAEIPRGVGSVPSVAERKAAFLREFELVPQRWKACKLVGIPYGTYDHWLNDDPEFKKRVTEIRKAYLGEVGDRAEASVIEGLSNPRNVWLSLEVARQHNQDWKRVDNGNGLTQVNIETAILNPHMSQPVPSVGTTTPGEDVPPGGHMGNGLDNVEPGEAE